MVLFLKPFPESFPVFLKELKGFSSFFVPACFGVGVFLVFLVVLSHSLWVENARGDVVVGGWNWGDFFVHLGIVQSINAGNFPPQQPTFSGFEMTYHYFIDFHAAVFSKFARVFFAYVARFQAAVYASCLFLVSFFFAFFLSRKKGVALVAALLMVFGGGFGFVELFNDLSEGKDFFKLISERGYDNNGEFFQVPSVLGGYLIVQRPQMVGIPVFLSVVYFFLSGFPGNRRRLFLGGLFLGMLAPFQYYAFASALGVCLLYVFFHGVSGFLRKDFKKSDFFSLVFFFIPSLASIPFVSRALSTAGSAHMLGIHLGWVAPLEPLEFVFFYLANFGLPFVLAVFSLVFLRVEKKFFLFAWIVSLFVVANVFSFSAVLWDMCKFFTFMWFPVCFLAACLVWRLPKFFMPFLLFFSMLSPSLILLWHYNSTWIGLDRDDVAVAKWVYVNTPELSVFATAPVHNTAIDLAGRLRLNGYSGWMANYGLPFREREIALQRIYCGSVEDSLKAVTEFNVSFILYSPNEMNYFKCSPSFTGFSKLVYSSGLKEVYLVRKELKDALK